MSTTGATLLYPHWVKLVRQGNTFSAYRSTDGSKWTLVGTETITMNAQVYIGIATCSHNTSVIAEASFDHVNIATSLPVISSAANASGVVTMPFEYTISASNTPYQFNATGLPDSVTVDKETGILAGASAVAGTFPVIIAATNALGTATDTLTLVYRRRHRLLSSMPSQRRNSVTVIFNFMHRLHPDCLLSIAARIQRWPPLWMI